MEKKDCQCLPHIHKGPHWLHMDEIWYEMNHAIFEQALRYEEYALAIRQAHPENATREHLRAYNRWMMLRDNQLHCHAVAELARLKEKEREMVSWGIEDVSELQQKKGQVSACPLLAL